MSAGNCYWCGASATCREHVPPKCLFPESKDSAYNVELRSALITVPSCDEHNIGKSKDDEYLLCILAVSVLNNAVGLSQALTKVRRALVRSPGLVKAVLPECENVLLRNRDSGELQPSIAIKVNTDRVLNALEHIARAIYYHAKGNSWKGQVQCHPEFLMNVEEPDAGVKNAAYEKFRSCANKIFEDSMIHGDNPDVFCYQIEENPDESKCTMRLTFYGGTRATIFLTGVA